MKSKKKSKNELLNIWKSCGGKPQFSMKRAIRPDTWERRIVREYWKVGK